MSVDKPLPDAIPSGRTPDREEAVSPHPCLKPQHFMRIIVRALLPLGEGTVLDPFMGSGSTIAAAEAVGYDSIGVELDKAYFKLAEEAVPRLAAFYPTFKGERIELNADLTHVIDAPENQMALTLAEESVSYGVPGKRKPLPPVRGERSRLSKKTVVFTKGVKSAP